MDTTNVPSRLAVRLDATDREAVAMIAGAIATPHRRNPSVTEAMRAALSIAAEAVRAHNPAAAD